MPPGNSPDIRFDESSPLPNAAARAVMLHAQALSTPNGAEPSPTRDHIYSVIERLGCLQIDTLHMVQRSHYLTLWTRLGQYDTADLDALAYDPAARRLYEYWQHAAALIPLAHFRYSEPEKAAYASPDHRWTRWTQQPENTLVIDQVRARITAEGGLRAADFKDDGPKRGSWWDWKPAKRALEYLYDCGELMIGGRVKFQRVYDLRERVLPGWVDARPATREEMARWRCEAALRALGLGDARHIADYAYLRITEARPVVAALVEEGIAVPVVVLAHDGEPLPLLVHRDHLPLLAQAAEGAISAGRTTFIGPFDSFLWSKSLVARIFGFLQVFEAYVPAHKRQYGHYNMPVLHGDQLVARFDPKLERKAGLLRLKALFWESPQPDDARIVAVAGALRDFMAWHGASDLAIDRSEPSEHGDRLLRAL